jgi:hypothetical protein
MSVRIADDLGSLSGEPMGERRMRARPPGACHRGEDDHQLRAATTSPPAAEPDGLHPTRARPRPPRPERGERAAATLPMIWAPHRASRWGNAPCAPAATRCTRRTPPLMLNDQSSTTRVSGTRGTRNAAPRCLEAVDLMAVRVTRDWSSGRLRASFPGGNQLGWSGTVGGRRQERCPVSLDSSPSGRLSPSRPATRAGSLANRDNS